MKLLKNLLFLIIATILISGYVSAQEDEVDNDMIVPTVETGPSIKLIADTITVNYGESLDVNDFILQGYWDTLALPVVDTKQLGEQTLYFVASKGYQEVKTKLSLYVVDANAPVFEESINTITYDYDEEVDLDEIKSHFTITDETEVTVEVVGEINTTQSGKSKVSIVATDTSGNEASHELEVIVKEKPIPKPLPIIPPNLGSDTSFVASGGNSFNARVTYYGVDCYGCRINSLGQGHTASGHAVSLDSVYQNGQWQPGITYQGYVILAADPQYAYCTIIELTNHGLTGGGFDPNTPIRGIVLDRGGGIRGTHFDVFVGSQRNTSVRHYRSNTQATVIGQLSGCR